MFTSKYLNIEFVKDFNQFGLSFVCYIDWKCIQINLFGLIFTFNFSGEWAAGWKSLKDKKMKNNTIDFMELKWSNNGVPYKNKVFTGYTGPFPKATGHEFDGLKKALEQDEKLWVDKNDS